MAASHWDECALPECRKFFWNEFSASECCSPTCSRYLRYLRSRVEPKVLIARFEEFANQPEVKRNASVMRAAWRVFGRG